MLRLQEYRSTARGMPDLLQYALMPEDGILQTKSGGFLASWYFRGKDTGSSTHSELATLSGRLNAILGLLGEGWMMHIDAIRTSANTYPTEGAFPDRTSRIIDEERRQQFQSEGAHFETTYAFTLTQHPPKLAQQKMIRYMYDHGGKNEDGNDLAARTLAHYKKIIDDFESVFSGLMPVSRMHGIYEGKDQLGRDIINDELLQYLEYCITGVRRNVRLPVIPMYLDAVIGAHDFVTGNKPVVGNRHVRAIAIDGFAQESYPGIFSALDDLAIEYRWSTRFIFYEPYRAKKMLEKVRNKWAQKQRGMKDQVLNTAKGPVNLDAIAMTQDVEAAMAVAEGGLVKFGQYTSVIILSNEDETTIDEDARKVTKAIMNAGYGARIEGPNAVEAYLGSLPGHHRENVRRPLLHTLNLSDMLPITSVWPGLAENPCPFFPKHSPALAYAATTGSTPFRVNLHVGDVGHALVLGKTGGGKSTMLTFLEAQFLRYPNAQVFAFDNGMAGYVLTSAVGGDHYDVGSPEEGSLSFCPLADLKNNNDIGWAIDWTSDLLRLQKYEVNAAVMKVITSAVHQHAKSVRDEGASPDLTSFLSNIQSTEIRESLEPYTLNGRLGNLLDAREDRLGHSRFQTFEMEKLLQLPPEYYAPVLLYLFRKVEQRLTGAPTLVPIDEAWMALMIEAFRDRVDGWLRTWRKKNASVILATQNMGDAIKSPLFDVLMTNCPTLFLLPNSRADDEISRPMYESIGMNPREIEIIASATEKRQYYYASPLGRRLFSYGFGQVALSFVGATGKEDIALAKNMKNEHGERWPAEWLRQRGLPDWADYWQKL